MSLNYVTQFLVLPLQICDPFQQQTTALPVTPPFPSPRFAACKKLAVSRIYVISARRRLTMIVSTCYHCSHEVSRSSSFDSPSLNHPARASTGRGFHQATIILLSSVIDGTSGGCRLVSSYHMHILTHIKQLWTWYPPPFLSNMASLSERKAGFDGWWMYAFCSYVPRNKSDVRELIVRRRSGQSWQERHDGRAMGGL